MSEATGSAQLSPVEILFKVACDRTGPAGLQRSRSWNLLLQEMVRPEQHREGGCWLSGEQNGVTSSSGRSFLQSAWGQEAQQLSAHHMHLPITGDEKTLNSWDSGVAPKAWRAEM